MTVKLVKEIDSNAVKLKAGNRIIAAFYFDYDTINSLEKAAAYVREYGCKKIIKEYINNNRKKLTCYNLGILA